MRTHLTFAAATWAPAFLPPVHLAMDRGPLGLISAEYRKGLRVLTGVDVYVRCSVLFIATLKWPVEVALTKAVFRYFQRLVDDMGER